MPHTAPFLGKLLLPGDGAGDFFIKPPGHALTQAAEGEGDIAGGKTEFRSDLRMGRSRAGAVEGRAQGGEEGVLAAFPTIRFRRCERAFQKTGGPCAIEGAVRRNGGGIGDRRGGA